VVVTVAEAGDEAESATESFYVAVPRSECWRCPATEMVAPPESMCRRMSGQARWLPHFFVLAGVTFRVASPSM